MSAAIKAFDITNKEMRKLEIEEKKYKDKLAVQQAKIKKYRREIPPITEPWTEKQTIRIALLWSQHGSTLAKLDKVQEEMKVVAKKVVAAELVARQNFQAGLAAYKRDPGHTKLQTAPATSPFELFYPDEMFCVKF